MKRLLNLLAFLFVLMFSSCGNDSGSSTTNVVAGQWKLVAVDGTFAGIHNTFASGLITWDFNSITQTVTVVNNNIDSNLWDVLETGVYNYQLVSDPDSPCGESIKINGIVYGCYSFSNNTLLIDQAIADGFSMKLVH